MNCGKVLVSNAASIVGGAGGATIGAFVGGVFGPVGSMVGMVVGAIVGSVSFAIVTKKAMEMGE